MKLLNKDFLNKHSNDFWTENVAMTLYALIKTQRPKNIIECGFGYTTNFIGEAIKDIEEEEPSYSPNFTIVDMFANQTAHVHREDDAMSNIIKDLEEKDLNNGFEVIKKDMMEYVSSDDFRQKTYDFIWADFGNGEEYLEFFFKALQQLEEGGVLIMHNTVCSALGRIFILEAELIVRQNLGLEMINFVESHKPQQNSYTIFRKKFNAPLYGMYS